MTTLFRRQHTPSFGGATAWLNSGPLDPAGLRRVGECTVAITFLAPGARADVFTLS
jgi:hypothetical protein